MIFRGKKLSDIEEQELQRLVDDQFQERDTVEYKRDIYGNSDEDKREMLKDITSMSNHRGGYIVIGIEADDEGIPTTVVGIEAGNHVERITSSCLDNVDKRMVGLEIKDIPLSNGRVVIIISIPESINAPHMVTYKGLNQFWRRHGRQKDKMTIDEIGEAFDRRLSNLNRLDRFLYTRKAEILEDIGDNPWMVMSSSPSYIRDEIVFDVHDEVLRSIVQNPPKLKGMIGDISCGEPYTTINGLRADNRSPYNTYYDTTLREYIELFCNGYIEYGRLMPEQGELGLYFASVADTAYIVNFVRLIRKIYEIYLPLTPVVVSCAIYNAKGIWLAVSKHLTEQDKLEKWKKQHLELGEFYVENTAEEFKILPKRISDRIWQAFHREKATVFDGAGTFRFE